MRRSIKSAAIFSALVVFLFSFQACMPGPDIEPIPQRPPKSYKINGKWYHPINDSSGFRQTGVASWYGAPFHGRKTASGETYDMHARTAAHKTLPMGTYVLVRCIGSGKETVVRINDRGPFVRGRIIDLSYRAARDISLVGPGTAEVEIAAMERGPSGTNSGGHPDFETGSFTVQVGAFINHSYAERLRRKLRPFHEDVCITRVYRNSRRFYRVRVGSFTSLSRAEDAEERLVEAGYRGAFAVASD